MAVSLNGDWTVNNKATMLHKAGNIAATNFPAASVFSICEVILGTARAFGASLSASTGKRFASVHGKVGYDNIAIAYDTDVWEIHFRNECFVSMIGKYVAIVLYHKETAKYVLFVAVHMPIKGGQARALTSARDFATGMINNGEHGITSAVLMGDWNCTRPTFARLQSCFRGGQPDHCAQRHRQLCSLELRCS